jgi:hypothetical protein
MLSRFASLFLLVLFSSAALADQIAFTSEGRTVILKDDFTWRYAEDGETALGACPKDMVGYRGRSKDLVIVCSCAPGTTVGRVFGHRIYTDDSSVCAAARHAGAIGANGGVVNVMPEGGCLRYLGTEQNGVISQAFGKWLGSFVIGKYEIARKPKCEGWDKPDCPHMLKGNEALVDRLGELWCYCPDSRTRDDRAWGTWYYTDDSSICTAARHAGGLWGQLAATRADYARIVGDGGWEGWDNVVMVRFGPACSRYQGSTRNGVTTLDYGAYPRSIFFYATVTDIGGRYVIDPPECKP